MGVEHRPNRIVLVRHGESLANIDDTIYETVPDHRIGLTAKGIEHRVIVGVQHVFFVRAVPGDMNLPHPLVRHGGEVFERIEVVIFPGHVDVVHVQ